MARGLRRLGHLGMIVVVLAACSAGTPNPTPSPTLVLTPVPVATTFGEFRTAFCRSWEAIFRAVGNPDTASDSELNAAMEAAIDRNDLAEVDRLAALIEDELTAGRAQVAFGAGFEPGAAMMREMDRLFVGFEAMIEARRDAAHQGAKDWENRGQAAFEAAGAIEAWSSMREPETWGPLASSRPTGESPQSCETVPVGL